MRAAEKALSQILNGYRIGQFIDKLARGREVRFGLWHLSHCTVHVAQAGVQTPQQESRFWHPGGSHCSLQEGSGLLPVIHSRWPMAVATRSEPWTASRARAYWPCPVCKRLRDQCVQDTAGGELVSRAILSASSRSGWALTGAAGGTTVGVVKEPLP
jgi:hypothetical protein